MVLIELETFLMRLANVKAHLSIDSSYTLCPSKKRTNRFTERLSSYAKNIIHQNKNQLVSESKSHL